MIDSAFYIGAGISLAIGFFLGYIFGKESGVKEVSRYWTKDQLEQEKEKEKSP